MSINTPDINKMVKEAYNALEDKKAEDIKIIHIGEVSVIADYFVIANGSNPSQVSAMVDNVEEKLSKAGYHHKNIEGVQNSSWVLMDYGDVIVHIFGKEDREFYNLEHIWGDCEIKTIDQF